MMKTINQIIKQRDNDYTHLELKYKSITNSELVIDPFNSITFRPKNINLTVSIIIPAWNASDTIQKCLKSTS